MRTIAMKKTVSQLMLLFLLLVLLSSCAGSDQTAAELTFEQLHGPGRKIGVIAGTGDDQSVAAEFPDAEIVYFNTYPTGYAAVSGSKIDAFVYVKVQMELAVRNGLAGVKVLDETVGESHLVVDGISPAAGYPDLENKLNQFIDELLADGTMNDMYQRWVVQHDYTMPEIAVPEKAATCLRVATSGTEEPFTFYEGTELRGLDIEMAQRFAAWLDTGLEIKVYDYSGCIAAAQSGDADCIMASMFYTPERAQVIHFSHTLFRLDRGIMVKKQQVAGASFWTGLAESFEKTFIRENRWQLFVSGIGTTLLITVLAILLGTALGFGVFLLCRKGNPAANAITRFFVWLIQGMPVVVLLMILYYIVFGSLSISGTLVSVIGFTLVFGAAVYALVKNAVATVDRGQTEAAYALGYTDRRAFFRIVLPQALPHFTPGYLTQITALIKATAVVGYVTVQDLTKIGDIIRSRTYDAFFPLIAVAVFYFVLAAILTFLVRKIGTRIDPKQRKGKALLKGVKTVD